MAIRDLFHEAAAPITTSPAEQLTTTVRRRLRRRTALRVTVPALAAVVLAGVGYPVVRSAVDTSLPPAGGAPVALPTDRGVGHGASLSLRCGGTDCEPTLTTVDGRRYRLPWSQTESDGTAIGVALSPDGRWLVYNRDGHAVLRDLTGTTAYPVRGSGNAAAPEAWSSNGRWVVIQPARRDPRGPIALRQPVRVDLRNGRQISFTPPKISPGYTLFNLTRFGNDLAVLPSGDIVVPQAGPKPDTQHQARSAYVYGPGVFHVVDPVTGKERRQVTVQHAMVWTEDTVIRPKSQATAKLLGGMASVTARSDGRYLAFSFSRYAPPADRSQVLVSDLSSGATRVVDVAALLGPTRAGDLSDLAVQSYTDHALTLVAGNRRIVLSGDATRVVSVGRMPGGTPPGVVTRLMG